MTGAQMILDLRGWPRVGDTLHRIRTESRDESEKGRWFEQLFARIARQEPEFEIDDLWRWPDWPERDRLTGLDGRDIGIDLVARRTSRMSGYHRSDRDRSVTHQRRGNVRCVLHLPVTEESH